MVAGPVTVDSGAQRVLGVSPDVAAIVMAMAGAGATGMWLLAGLRLQPYGTMGWAIIGPLLAACGLLMAPTPSRWRFLAAAMLAFTLIAPALASPAQGVGDFPEYYLYETSFMRHATPEQTREDQQVYLVEALEEGMPRTIGLNFAARNGNFYVYHFWASALTATPIGLLLRAIGVNWLRAFAVMNALLIFVAFIAALWWAGLPRRLARTFAAFWIVSPVTWYLGWPSAEVWSAALVMLAIVLFSRRKYAFAVLLTAVASMQNPPILLLAGALAATGAYAAWQRGQRRHAIAAILSLTPALAPYVYYRITLQAWNPIVYLGEAGWKFVSVQRMLSFYLDLNQGVVMYAPTLLVVGVVALLIALRRRLWFALALAGVCAGMTLLSAMGGDWCSGCVGIIRWAVWQLPVIAWMGIGVLRSEHDANWLRALLVGQLAVALLVVAWPAYTPNHLDFGPAARFVLEVMPSAYRPEPDIFFDRTMHREVSDSTENPLAMPNESIAYVGKDGAIRKVLVPDMLVADTASALNLTESDFRADMYAAGRKGLYYYDHP